MNESNSYDGSDREYIIYFNRKSKLCCVIIINPRESFIRPLINDFDIVDKYQNQIANYQGKILQTGIKTAVEADILCKELQVIWGVMES